jgi:hypothetical protein
MGKKITVKAKQNQKTKKSAETTKATIVPEPCCSRAYITYPYLNGIYCLNCGTPRVPIPHSEKKEKGRKKKS